jgi:uncharacterized protein (DUF433 family)
MATPTKTLRLRPKLRAEIERIARRTRRSFTEVTQDLLEEALRMRQCPGIYFADEPAGRVAKVGATGLGVWEVIRDWQAAKGDQRKLARVLPHLGAVGLKAALLYYERYAPEVDDAIADNEAAFRALKAGAGRLARQA